MKAPFRNRMTRREMLQKSCCGFGYLALASLFADLSASASPLNEANPLAPRSPHLPARAKRIIFLFMHGGPSQVDTFDPKPLLIRDNGKLLSSVKPGEPGGPNSKLLASPWEFSRHGRSGLEISSLFPEVGSCADDLCLIRSMHTDGQSHEQAVLSFNTGMNTQVRPSMGSWIVYGLGTDNQNLPGFVTISPPVFNGGPQNYGSAFLPAAFQGTPIGRENTPLSEAQIRHIKNAELPLNQQRLQLDFLQQMNREHLKRAEVDAQIDGVIESYELAFRMQTEAPKLTNLSDESKETLDLYGINQEPTDNFGRQCLLARRFAEKGVRFIQVNHAFKWDQHMNLKRDHEKNAREVDKPIAALLQDLKALGLLDETLVLWGGEFGRTPAGQGNDGRDHNPHGFTVWLAGGGVKGGMAYGATDDYGYRAVENKVHMHDLHATLLHLLGLDHTKLTYRYAGRDFRLTDVHGEVIKAILS